MNQNKKKTKKHSRISNNIGIKYDFPFINIRWVPRGVLKTEGVARGFQHSPRDLANVNPLVPKHLFAEQKIIISL